MMRFGFFSLLDVYDTEARTSAAIYQQTLEQIALADELGFDSYWIGEHHGYVTPNQLLSCPNPAILLAAAAKLTRRIGLNTAVANLSLRHPLQTAEDYALVDILSQAVWAWVSVAEVSRMNMHPLDKTRPRVLVVLRKVGIVSSGSGAEKA